MKAKYLIWPVVGLLLIGHYCPPVRLITGNLLALAALLWIVPFLFRLLRFCAPLILFILLALAMWR